MQRLLGPEQRAGKGGGLQRPREVRSLPDELLHGAVHLPRVGGGPVAAVQELDDGDSQPSLVADLLCAATDPVHVPRGRLDPVPLRPPDPRAVGATIRIVDALGEQRSEPVLVQHVVEMSAQRRVHLGEVDQRVRHVEIPVAREQEHPGEVQAGQRRERPAVVVDVLAQRLEQQRPPPARDPPSAGPEP